MATSRCSVRTNPKERRDAVRAWLPEDEWRRSPHQGRPPPRETVSLCGSAGVTRRCSCRRRRRRPRREQHVVSALGLPGARRLHGARDALAGVLVVVVQRGLGRRRRRRRLRRDGVRRRSDRSIPFRKRRRRCLGCCGLCPGELARFRLGDRVEQHAEHGERGPDNAVRVDVLAEEGDGCEEDDDAFERVGDGRRDGREQVEDAEAHLVVAVIKKAAAQEVPQKQRRALHLAERGVRRGTLPEHRRQKQ
mmetsp:Transcript_12232/g.49283  ORF Transcript_12232/g.49283 Transcript_12232/m.49283 type:complete len:249 (+) Transcript_12232:176-922(+)